ncbi:coat protein [ssRNA phage Gephyllon.4_1]|uniref:Coat protein n=2 Tax=Leviviricetes TaxID=2842243 RepID=A0A8S5L3A5_9VIRU|nr:coat protein [ssRNA phage Gephyllon.4_1]QDH89088.1 MAG: hypothetical protein H4BulkLitter22251_000003 [Leviviridae sp.]DAD52153.1 TPA_asm: coat protein [ssRNA phage Gephyllon.4_1]
MLTDPQTIVVAGVTKSLPKTSSKDQSSTYNTADLAYTLKISHNVSGQKIRSVERTDYRALVTDPVSGDTDWQVLSVYTVIERPITGFSATQVSDLLAGHQARMDSTHIAKLYGGES